MNGLLIAGATPRCGKTIVAAGIMGVLLDLGFKTQAVKPLIFSEKTFSERADQINPDQAYLDMIENGRAMQRVETVLASSPYEVNTLLWNRMMENCKKSVYPLVIESPGTVAQPLRMDGNVFIDAVDWSLLLELPILLTVRKSPQVIADLAPALAYLYEGEADVIGWVAVETRPEPYAHWDEDRFLISREYDTPFLGEITWSPSISVEMRQQGNLLKLTEAGVDLLPIQQAMDLAFC